MTLKDVGQPSDAPSEQPLRDDDGVHGDLDRLPDVLYAPDLARIYRVSVSRIYALASEGAFVFAEIKPRIGRQAWSRDRIRQHVRGELRGLTISTSVRRRA